MCGEGAEGDWGGVQGVHSKRSFFWGGEVLQHKEKLVLASPFCGHIAGGDTVSLLDERKIESNTRG